ncbi:MAG: helix-turn-helix domain-containing protein [Hominisplanchenecus sp.]
MKTGKKLTFRSILLSYLVLCTVMLGITGAGYISSVFYIQKEIRTSAGIQMRELIGRIENNIRLSYQLSDTLAAGKEIMEIASMEGEFTPEQIIQTMELKNTLSQLNLQNNICQNIHIYFLKSNSIVSSNSKRRSGDSDIRFFCKEFNLETKDFYHWMNDEMEQSYQILDHNLVWFLRPVYDTDGRRTAVIISEYSGSRLAGIGGSDRIVTIRTPDGEKSLYSRLLDEKEKKNYIEMQEAMNLFRWECSMFVPNTMFYEELRRFMMVLSLQILIFIAAAAASSWYLSKRTYIPVGDLIRDNRRLSRSVKNRNRMQEGYELSKYLSGVVKKYPLSRLEEKLSGRKYRMALICFEGENRQELNGQGEAEDLESFVLNNILEERVFEHYKGLMIQMEKHYVILAGMRDNGKEIETLHAMLDEIVAFYKDTFRISACVMISRQEEGYEGLKQVYEKLEEGMRYLNFWNSNVKTQAGVYLYGEMPDTDENVNYSVYMTGSRKLLNCLESEDFEGAYRELNKIYLETFSRSRKDLKYNIYRMYGLISILITTLDVNADEDDRKYYQTLNYEERLFRIQSIHEFMDESRAIFEDIIRYRESRAKEKEPEWLNDMLLYVEHHYYDSDLSVSKIADEFEISVPHVSRSFKNWMGCGVLEYIHRVRLKHAKEQLKEGNSVKQVASAVGYTDAQALTRAFKRYEGITPSQYREIKTSE